MLYKVTSALVALFCIFACASATGSNVYINLVNALIARTDLNALNGSPYNTLGFSAPSSTSACTASGNAYPSIASLGGSGFSTLNICYGSNVAYPYHTQSGVTGTGIENQLISTWASLLNTQYSKTINVNFVSITVTSTGLFASLQSALQSGTQCQVAISSIFQTTDRDNVATASCPYSTTSSAVLVGPAGSSATKNITALSQLNDASVTVATATGSASSTYLKNTYPLATYLYTTSTTESINSAANSSASVAVGDAAVINYYAQTTNPTLCGGSQCRTYNLANPSNLVAYALPQTATTTTAPKTSAASSVVAAAAVVVVAVFALVF